METLALAPTFAPLQQFRADWLTSQTRSVRGVVPRRAMHASRDSPCHSSAQPPLLGGLPPPHGAFQEHAAHLVEWSTTLSSKGSSGTCIPEGVATFFHAAFTAHSGSDAGADAGGSQVQRFVRRGVAILPLPTLQSGAETAVSGILPGLRLLAPLPSRSSLQLESAPQRE